MNKLKVYTKTGDDGTTSLVGGKRVRKTDLRLEAYGSIDEMNSLLGLLTTYLDNSSDLKNVRWIQNKLFSVGGNLATDTTTTKLPDSYNMTENDVIALESMIDQIEEELPEHNSFILPGGNRAAAVCHIARTVCRRSERVVLKLGESQILDKNLIPFMNRLSDYLFVLSRRLNYLTGSSEIFWQNDCE
ncbi:MAG TPA: cob(I)yrinic acid a,c-diamide adenosyltransferase [Bacteroidaceae bacterium]|nr:cob(I)yrinic acid a,c-diamide adenosyltransferase [Bacteroidaceae bacterium]